MRPFTCFLMCLMICSNLAADEIKTFFPVISSSGADPWVIRHDDGFYYLSESSNGSLSLRRSKRLTGIGGGESRVIWSPPKSGPTSKNLWAPELHRINGKWYVYFAADDGDNANHRMYVLENDSPDPFRGEFVLKGKIADPHNDRWAIDGTVLTWKDRLYFIWSGWEGTTNVRQLLYIAPMSNPWTISGPRVELSRPTRAWETVGNPTVNEGPQVLIRNTFVHLIYSASGSWTDDYCLGRLTLKPDGDPLDPNAWVKHPESVLRRGNGVYGPGHGSFTKSPDGREDWLVYHAARHKGAGWARNLRMQAFAWNDDDTPRFGMPADPDRPIPLPSGEAARQRWEAERAKRLGVTSDLERSGASGGRAVAEMNRADSGVEFEVDVTQAGHYHLALRHANGSANRGVIKQQLTLNDQPARSIDYDYTAGNWSVAAMHLELKAGRNSIRITGRAPNLAIDCLDLAWSREKK